MSETDKGAVEPELAKTLARLDRGRARKIPFVQQLERVTSFSGERVGRAAIFELVDVGEIRTEVVRGLVAAGSAAAREDRREPQCRSPSA